MDPCGIFMRLRVHFQMVPFRLESAKVGMVDLNAHESTAGQRSKSSYIFFMRIGSSYIRSSCMHTCIQKKKRCKIMTLELGVLEFVSVPSWYDVQLLTTCRYDLSMTGATGHSSAPDTCHHPSSNTGLELSWALGSVAGSSPDEPGRSQFAGAERRFRLSSVQRDTSGQRSAGAPLPYGAF